MPKDEKKPKKIKPIDEIKNLLIIEGVKLSPLQIRRLNNKILLINDTEELIDAHDRLDSAKEQQKKQLGKVKEKPDDVDYSKKIDMKTLEAMRESPKMKQAYYFSDFLIYLRGIVIDSGKISDFKKRDKILYAAINKINEKKYGKEYIKAKLKEKKALEDLINTVAELKEEEEHDRNMEQLEEMAYSSNESSVDFKRLVEDGFGEFLSSDDESLEESRSTNSDSSTNSEFLELQKMNIEQRLKEKEEKRAKRRKKKE